MSIKLPEEINSAEDLKAVLEELRDFRTYFRHSEIKAKSGKNHTSDGPDLSMAAAKLLSQAKNKKQLTMSELEQLLSELELIYSKAPKIRIVLAAAATPPVKKRLADWIRSNISDQAFIDFRYDSTILGGMIIACGSHIYDWSLRREIIASKDKMKEVIAHV